MSSAIISLTKGLCTFVPGLYNFVSRKKTGGTVSARYCYSVWMRHLLWAHRCGFKVEGATVAELGPGDSLGTGLAALLSGASKYYGLDVVDYAADQASSLLLDELVELFHKQSPIPDEREFPRVQPLLPSYAFPCDILTEAVLERSLNPARIAAIREAVINLHINENPEECVCYYVPYYDVDVIKDASVDLIFTQAVMEYVDDPANTYSAIKRWIKPSGLVQLEVDFGSHALTKEWNGHLGFSDWTWALVRGKRPYFLNRMSCSNHLQFLESSGLSVIGCNRKFIASDLNTNSLAYRFRSWSQEDLTTKSAFIQAVSI